MLKIDIWDPKIVMFTYKCQKTLVADGKDIINERYYVYKREKKSQQIDFYSEYWEKLGPKCNFWVGFGQK